MVLRFGSMSEEPLTDGVPGLSSLSIRKASTADNVAEALRELIVNGQIPQGQPLREVALAQRLSVSRNTVREAIRALAREGLVTSSPYKGTVVTRLTRADVADIFRVRRVVELALAYAPDEDLAPLAADVRAMEIAAEQVDWSGMIDADRAFHEHLVGLLHSSRLSRFYDAVGAEMRLCMSIVDRHDESPASLVAEHKELLELIVARDIARLSDLISTHLLEGEQMLAARVADDDVP
jgi:DNA-binding GntR family transcriptional regulator